jgi:integrase
LSEEQARMLLAVACGHRLEALLTLALTTGMRRGELLALRWQDINFDNKSLHILRTLNRLVGYGFIETEPKTSKSRRKIILPDFVIDMLKQHRAHQLEERLKAGVEWQDHDLVFSNTHGGFLQPDRLREMLQKLLKEAGLPYMRFHDLRHSAATILLSMGVHPKVVQELLGHSAISMTMDTYSHVLPSMHQEAMEKMDETFRQK